MPRVLLILVLVPLGFSSINSSHDWGGDFAQYLNNAKDLVNGSYHETPEVLDHENFTPLTRGAGFSLILAGFYPFFKDEIFGYTTLISFMWILASLVLFQYFKTHEFRAPIGILMVMVFALNPSVFALKLEILPTFLFLTFLYIGLILAEQQHKNVFLLALVTGLMISFRNVGWVFVLAVIIHLGYDLVRVFQWHKVLKITTFLLLTLSIDLVIKWLVFRNLSFENIFWYGSAIAPGLGLPGLQQNIGYYYELIHVFVKPFLWGSPHSYFQKFVLIIVFIGFISRLRNWQIADTFFVIYLLLLFFYPAQSGMRFLIPVVPMVIVYLALGLNWIIQSFDRKRRLTVLLPFLVMGLFLFNQVGEIWTIRQKSKALIYGPQTSDASEAFEYIKTHVSKDEIVVFHKPWVLHHYTDRISMAINPKKGPQSLTMSYLDQKIATFEAKYLMVCIDPLDRAVYHEGLVYSLKENEAFNKVWSNDSFVLLVRDE